ncbi:MAG: hypothetical protein J0H21_07610, partial [Rhizobiales bacterium]|nr:hypothetical protein [Hyphomicrobiales bacterium]
MSPLDPIRVELPDEAATIGARLDTEQDRTPILDHLRLTFDVPVMVHAACRDGGDCGHAFGANHIGHGNESLAALSRECRSGVDYDDLVSAIG